MFKPGADSQGDDPARWREQAYPSDYSAQVQKAIGFIGVRHDFFVEGKARWLQGFLRRHSLAAHELLDIGCGVGLLHKYLAGIADHVRGVDVSAEAIDRARAENPHHDYSIYDGANLPFPAGFFDITLAVTVMHHVPVAQWSAFVAEAARMLHPGGAFIVIEHNPFNPLTRYSVSQCPFDADAVLLRAKRVTELMRGVGLADCGQDYIFFTPFKSDLLQAIERRLTWLPLGAQYAAWGFKR
jgi:2-polyprenyl-3-methyl-5-hydroxy-6-metoxy-1,4-benzoquinol methylase